MGKTLKIFIAGIIIIVVFMNCTQKKKESPTASYSRSDVIGLWVRDPIPMILDYRILMDIREDSTYGLYADTTTGDTIFVHEGTWHLPSDSVIHFIGTNCHQDTSDAGLEPFPCGDDPIPVTIDIRDTLNSTYWLVLVGEMESVAASIGIDVTQFRTVVLYCEKRR
jgi:hypothetical protein